MEVPKPKGRAVEVRPYLVVSRPGVRVGVVAGRGVLAYNTQMAIPFLIGIAGASCSGKSTVAEALAARLGPECTLTLGLDSYYFDLSHLTPEAIHAYNLDEPAALDEALLVSQLADLAEGRAIAKPVYDYKTHTRAALAERIEPPGYVIIEGLFALHWPQVRELLGLRVYIDAPHDLCLSRRIARDRNQRGRTPEEVTRRYRAMVGPMADRHVVPTRPYADVIVDGLAPVEKSVDLIMIALSSKRRSR